jgi:alpha-tubulin suppressor-like RCC1 family protein
MSKTVVSVSSKGYHSLVLTESGQVFSLGKNNFGQLGLGHQTNRGVPSRVRHFGGDHMGASDLVCGCYHSIVLGKDNSVYVFGDNNRGQLRLGDNECRALSGLMLSHIACGSARAVSVARLEQAKVD